MLSFSLCHCGFHLVVDHFISSQLPLNMHHLVLIRNTLQLPNLSGTKRNIIQCLHHITGRFYELQVNLKHLHPFWGNEMRMRDRGTVINRFTRLTQPAACAVLTLCWKLSVFSCFKWQMWDREGDSLILQCVVWNREQKAQEQLFSRLLSEGKLSPLSFTGTMTDRLFSFCPSVHEQGYKYKSHFMININSKWQQFILVG